MFPIPFGDFRQYTQAFWMPLIIVFLNAELFIVYSNCLFGFHFVSLLCPVRIKMLRINKQLHYICVKLQYIEQRYLADVKRPYLFCFQAPLYYEMPN